MEFPQSVFLRVLDGEVHVRVVLASFESSFESSFKGLAYCKSVKKNLVNIRSL